MKGLKAMRNRNIIQILLSASLVAFLMAACQPTPEVPIIPQKGDFWKDIEGNVQEITPSPTLSSDYESTVKYEFQSVDRWEDNLDIQNCETVINADVIVPNIETYPLVKVKSRYFGQEDIESFFDLFYPDGGIRNYIRDSEDVIMEQLLYAKTLLVQLQQGIHPADDLRPIQEQIESCEIEISELEKKLYAYREGNDGNELDMTLHEIYKGHHAADFIGKHNGKDYIMEISNDDDSGGSIYFYYQGRINTTETAEINEWNEGIKKADALAQTYLKALGIDDAVLYKKVEAQMRTLDTGVEAIPVYKLLYVRSYNGVAPYPIDAIPVGMSTSDPNNDQYGRVAYAEEIRITTDGDEIYWFQWQYPYSVETVINRNVPLLPSEEAASIALTHLKVKLPGEEKTKAYLLRFMLNGMYITMKDEPDAFLVVPVWDLLGYQTYADGRRYRGEEERLLSFVTVNAIDGSIISRNRGY